MKDSKEETLLHHANDESIEELRNRLKGMRKLMEERRGMEEFDTGRRARHASVIDSGFLSVVFGIALVVIMTVSVYAFYNLYTAILKKFPHPHEEL